MLVHAAAVGLACVYGAIQVVGRDPLDIRSEQRESYWHRRTATRQTKEQFERLF